MWEPQHTTLQTIAPESLWERAIRQQELAEERNLQREIWLETAEEMP